jgi:hypothetical protein
MALLLLIENPSRGTGIRTLHARSAGAPHAAVESLRAWIASDSGGSASAWLRSIVPRLIDRSPPPPLIPRVVFSPCEKNVGEATGKQISAPGDEPFVPSLSEQTVVSTLLYCLVISRAQPTAKAAAPHILSKSHEVLLVISPFPSMFDVSNVLISAIGRLSPSAPSEDVTAAAAAATTAASVATAACLHPQALLHKFSSEFPYIFRALCLGLKIVFTGSDAHACALAALASALLTPAFDDQQQQQQQHHIAAVREHVAWDELPVISCAGCCLFGCAGVASAKLQALADVLADTKTGRVTLTSKGEHAVGGAWAGLSAAEMQVMSKLLRRMRMSSASPLDRVVSLGSSVQEVLSQFWTELAQARRMDRVVAAGFPSCLRNIRLPVSHATSPLPSNDNSSRWSLIIEDSLRVAQGTSSAPSSPALPPDIVDSDAVTSSPPHQPPPSNPAPPQRSSLDSSADSSPGVVVPLQHRLSRMRCLAAEARQHGARIAEYFGVSDAMISAREGRSRGWVCGDNDDVLEGLKRMADDSYEE